MHIYQWQMDPPWVNYRSLQHHYTSSLWHIKECTYTNGRNTDIPSVLCRNRDCIYTPGRWTPHELTIDLCNTTTLHHCDISKNAHIAMADGPPCQSTIDLCNTTTCHHLTHMKECTYINGRWTNGNERPTKWSGYGKIIDPLENFYLRKTFYPRGQLSSTFCGFTHFMQFLTICGKNCTYIWVTKEHRKVDIYFYQGLCVIRQPSGCMSIQRLPSGSGDLPTPRGVNYLLLHPRALWLTYPKGVTNPCREVLVYPKPNNICGKNAG